MAAPDTFQCTVIGKGGHAAIPHDTVDPIAVGALIVSALQHIVSRNVDPLDPVVVSVTQFMAGTTFNVIPSSAFFSGTVRTFDARLRSEVPRLMERVIAGITQAFGATYQFTFERGLLRARQGRPAEAAEYYARAIAENPAHRAALYNWGNLLAAAGRFDEAALKYAAAARLNPDDSDAVNNLGMALVLQGRADAAVQPLSEAVAFAPENGMLRMSLGRALSALGRGVEAAAQFREVLRLDPANTEARSALQALEPGRL
jgi:tetratricopeptide (TPR) repeat protein